MTTVNGKGGLTPVSSKRQSDWTAKLTQYPIASGEATSIFTGDIVTLATATGSVARAVVGFTAGTAVGIFVGCSFTNPTTLQPVFTTFWPGATVAADAVAYICDDKDAVFEIQSDAALTAAALGKNMLMVQTSVGSSVNGKSGINAQGSSIATTATHRIRVVGLKKTPDNNWTDTFPVILAKWNFGMHADDVALGI